MRKKVQATLKDIAAELGVTVMTVSQGLNGTGRISESTRQRVREAADRLNYSPNWVAKSLRMSSTRTIGIAVGDASQMFFSQVLRGIQDAAEAVGFNVMVSNTDQRPGKEKSVIDMLISKRLDGLIIVSPMLSDPDYVTYLKACGIPIVVLMRNLDCFDLVISDNEQGGYLAAEHLLNQGCKSPYYLLLPEVSQVGDDRLRGHLRALHDHGVDDRPERIWRTIPSIEGGMAAMKALLAHGFDGDSLCCDCDLIAIGAISELEKAGYRIPEQVKICGFNDLELSPYINHPLTTIRQHRYEIGKIGMELLMKRIQHRTRPVQKIVLPVELIARIST